MTARQFPRPWLAVEHTEAFVVEDASGSPVAYDYLTDDEQRRSLMQRMARDEARRIAVNVARRPEMPAGSKLDNQD